MRNPTISLCVAKRLRSAETSDQSEISCPHEKKSLNPQLHNELIAKTDQTRLMLSKRRSRGGGGGLFVCLVLNDASTLVGH